MRDVVTPNMRRFLLMALLSAAGCATTPVKYANRDDCEDAARRAFDRCSDESVRNQQAPGLTQWGWGRSLNTPQSLRDPAPIDRDTCVTGYQQQLEQCSKL